MNGVSRPVASAFVEGGFLVLPVLVFLAVWGLYRVAFAKVPRGPRPVAVGAGLLLWLSVTAGLGLSGLLSRFDLRPPPFGVLILGVLAASSWFGFSRVGETLSTLPLGWLVGLQAFRLPLEIVMHRASVEGVMPVQMSYSGLNFDVVTGATALVLSLALVRGSVPRWLVTAWNALGAILLANVVIVAILLTPMLHVFGTAPREMNTFVAFFPFVWLPGALVSTAIAFHIIVARALRRRPEPSV